MAPEISEQLWAVTHQEATGPIPVWPRRAVRLAGAIACVAGGVYLIAWFSGSAARWSANGAITVKTNMAAALFLAGLSLPLLSPWEAGGRRRVVGALAAAVVFSLGAATLSEHLVGWDLGIDQLLASEPPGAATTVSPNRIGPPGSTSLTLLGAALLALAAGRRRIVPWLGLAVFAINLVPAVGFLYGITAFYGTPRLTGIAWPTVVSLMSLGLGSMFAVGDSGPMVSLLRRDPGGVLMRRALPLAVLAPVVVNWLQEICVAHNLLTRDTADGLRVLTVALLLGIILWRSAAHVGHSSAAQTKAHQSLRESEHRLALAASGTGIGIFEWDIAAGEVTATERTVAIIGLRPTTTTTTTTTTTLSQCYEYRQWAERVHPDDLPAVEAEIQRCIDNHLPLDTEYRVVRPDGTVHWVAVRCIFHYGAQDEPTRLLGIVMDITERKRAEEAVAEAHQQLQSIIDNTTSMVYACDLEERFVMANAALAALLKTTPEQMIGKRRHEFMPQADANAHEADDRKVIAAGRAVEFEEYNELHGRSITWLSTKFPLRDAQGRICAVAGIVTDISGRKQAEADLRRAMEELQRSNRELEQFAYISSHDLQEPLRQVMSFGNLLSLRCAETLDDRAKQYIGFMTEGSQRMSNLVRGLLDYSRVGRLGQDVRPVAADAVLDSALLDLQASIKESGVHVTRDPLPTVVAHPGELGQLFQNLIGNALKFGRDGVNPQIHIGCCPDGQTCIFSVKDNGIGIPADQHEKAFVIFQRAHGDVKYRGTGIGLAICKKIVERHGGRIWIESTVGEGSTFFFTMPMAKEAQA